MKILIASHAFAPSIGGIESTSFDLAKEFCRLGHSVRIVTQTSSSNPEDDRGLPVLRQPGKLALLQAVRWCDVFWHNNLGVRTVWPLLVARRPLVITHAGSYCLEPAGIDLALRFKHAIVNRSTSIAVSQHVADCFKSRSIVIPNLYDIGIFRRRSAELERKRDLIFLGRLVTEKGIDVLLHALNLLRKNDLRPNLTIVGSGPELQPMTALAIALDIQEQVRFVGPKRGEELAQVLNEHKILVVPSRYQEPFGVVALEGIACGCVVVGSHGGGLPEAIGPCGATFPNGNSEELAMALENLLLHPAEQQHMLAAAPAHLARFHPSVIAESYLQVFRSVIEKTDTPKRA